MGVATEEAVFPRHTLRKQVSILLDSRLRGNDDGGSFEHVVPDFSDENLPDP